MSAVAIISLALGIGANITVYSVAREMIFDDVSAANPDRLAHVGANLTYAEYRRLRGAGIFEDTAFDSGMHDPLWRRGNRNEVAWVMQTSPNFFEVLGIRAYSGRLYGQADEGQPVAVVTYGFWSRRLHGEGTLNLNGKIYTVVGVLPRDYRSVMGHGVAPEIYRPLEPDSQARCQPFGRLRAGMTREQTRQALAAAAPPLGIAQFTRELPTLRPFSGFAANSLKTDNEGRVFVFFLALLGVAAMLALIACSNVAGLLLVRRMSRQREMAIRLALGANRWQLARPLLAEAVLLVAGGAAVGLAIDGWIRGRLRFLRWPTAYNIPFEFHFQTDRGLFLYALLTALAALAVCALGTGGDRGIAAATKPRPSRWNLRNGLISVQVVLSTVLLILGALFTRSFLHVANEGPGFDAAETLVVAARTTGPRLSEDEAWVWRSGLENRMRQVPGVLSITSTDLLPLMGEVPDGPVRRAGEPAGAARTVYEMAEGEDYFATLRIPMLRGRDFRTTDRTRQPVPAVVNLTLARQFFGDADPIGQHLIRDSRNQEVEIVGVAADSKMRTMGEAPMPAIYTPDFNGQFLVRVAGRPEQWMEPLRRALAGPNAAPDIRPLEDAVAGALFPIRVAAAFVGSLSGLGLLLALVGLYGSVSYAVSRRTKEMGIRSALGATRARILWTAAREASVLLGAGALVGLAFAISAVRPLADLLPHGVDPWDVRVFVGVALCLSGTGMAAVAVPAIRAARVDAAVALREE